MPEMKHLHDALILIGTVVNKNRAVNQFANPRPFADHTTHTRKAA